MSPPLENVQFRIVDKSKDAEKVQQLIATSFSADEPMCKALNLNKNRTVRNEGIAKYVDDCLETTLSLKAVDKSTKKIMGVLLNGIAERDTFIPKCDNFVDELRAQGDESWHLFAVIRDAHLNLQTSLFDEYNTDTLFYVKIADTSPSFRQGGILTELVQRSLLVAQALGFKAAFVECTGEYSKRAMLKNGFEIKAELEYKHYKCVRADGNNPFRNIEKPHSRTYIMARRL